MGNSSSRTNSKAVPPINGEPIGGTRGKTMNEKEQGGETKIANVVDDVEHVETFPSDEEEYGLVEESDDGMEESDEDDSEEEEEEDDEEMMERLRVLDDARKLKQLAEAFLYPERPVVTTSETACARNYFHRPSAPSQEDAEERARILEDAAALKKVAIDYAHPERPVETTDAYACGRNYFDRASAIEQESMEDVEERELILADARALKQLAADYAHPELAVATTDFGGRNYFDRPSAPEQEVDAKERDLILADMLELKKRAVEYLHPEISVVTTDETARGRNYFDRASAPEMESMADAQERARVMEDMKALKQLAMDYSHPELSVFSTDDTACGRLYFHRPSAPDQEEYEEERNLIMEDMKALKNLAVDYLHPELPVVTTDETACARNYFDRPSAIEQEEDAEERDLIMEDMKALKKLAVDFLHPELPVITTDETACARNYFDRPSAVEQEEDAEERDLIMEDMKALKKLAVEYAHPELGVVTSDDTAYGRNYFGRASAPEQMSPEEAEERARFLVDAMNLKKFAVDYAHPELPVVVMDEAAAARNYFGRASAPEVESADEAEERACILQDMQSLKKLAVDYAHPELPVVTTDPTACGRNYFVRASAKGHNFISTTREESIKFIDEEIEDDHYLDECDLHYGNFEMDEEMVTDMKYQLHTLLDHSHYALSSEVTPIEDKGEEEGKLSRSPSSVMLFGGYEEAAY